MSNLFRAVTIDVDGKKIKVLPKDYQLDPVRDFTMHVDFLRIGEHTTVTVAVPVVFADEDECRGLKQGGVLNITRHEVELVVDAADIPSEITISLKGREIGDSIHISDVKLPKGATPAIEDRDFAIATIVPPTVPTAEDEALEAEVAETQAAEAAAESDAESDEDSAEG